MAFYTHFSQEERCVLTAYLREGLSLRTIAKKLQRSVGGICMEIARSSPDGSREHYDPYTAHLGSRMKKWDANRRNPMKEEGLRTFVRKNLLEGWSPEVIAGRLKKDHKKHIVSHETIYQWAYRENLTMHLPRGKPRRHRRRWRLKASRGTQGLGLVPAIAERPAIVASRHRFGDWEGDSMLGRRKRGATLSVQGERRSRYVLLTKCKDKSAKETRRAVVRRLSTLKKSLRRTLTLDRGTENAEYRRFGLPVYFCDPYSSWQKGSVEQVIGLVRRYLPKRMDLASVTPKQLKAIQDRLNNRPRKCLEFRTPAEVLSSHCHRLGVQLPA
ncbi:MAG: IS30 family transposase [Candidatus Peribacteraceae bacterium]|nr:IS30 family transposase [Candidatus Peribacteraceae bacterium]